jgi:hypothetical protein
MGHARRGERHRCAGGNRELTGLRWGRESRRLEHRCWRRSRCNSQRRNRCGADRETRQGDRGAAPQDASGDLPQAAPGEHGQRSRAGARGNERAKPFPQPLTNVSRRLLLLGAVQQQRSHISRKRLELQSHDDLRSPTPDSPADPRERPRGDSRSLRLTSSFIMRNARDVNRGSTRRALMRCQAGLQNVGGRWEAALQRPTGGVLQGQDLDLGELNESA